MTISEMVTKIMSQCKCSFDIFIFRKKLVQPRVMHRPLDYKSQGPYWPPQFHGTWNGLKKPETVVKDDLHHSYDC